MSTSVRQLVQSRAEVIGFNMKAQNDEILDWRLKLYLANASQLR